MLHPRTSCRNALRRFSCSDQTCNSQGALCACAYQFWRANMWKVAQLLPYDEFKGLRGREQERYLKLHGAEYLERPPGTWVPQHAPKAPQLALCIGSSILASKTSQLYHTRGPKRPAVDDDLPPQGQESAQPRQTRSRGLMPTAKIMPRPLSGPPRATMGTSTPSRAPHLDLAGVPTARSNQPRPSTAEWVDESACAEPRPGPTAASTEKRLGFYLKLLPEVDGEKSLRDLHDIGSPRSTCGPRNNVGKSSGAVSS